MLQIIGKALEKNNIRFVTCVSSKDLSNSHSKKSSGQAPLDKFRYDLAIRVLLIPLSLGADGLSITEASHVFILEPLLNKTVEAQAVARVSRIGQLRPTFVHKYVLSKTIEERILKSQERLLPLQGDNATSEKKAMTLEVLNRLFE